MTVRTTLAVAAATVALLAMPGIASAADRNDDRIPDRWERRHDLSLKKDQARRDQDRDGLRNRSEFRTRMDPREDDSDGDGVEDGDEGAGTVESFDAITGRLRISVFGGDSISGLVTEETEIECDREDDSDEADDDSLSTLRHGGSNSGPGSENSGRDEDDGDSSGPGGDDDSNSGPGGDDEGDEEVCGADELVEGAIVQEAELELEDGKAVWEEIELRT